MALLDQKQNIATVSFPVYSLQFVLVVKDVISQLATTTSPFPAMVDSYFSGTLKPNKLFLLYFSFGHGVLSLQKKNYDTGPNTQKMLAKI